MVEYEEDEWQRKKLGGFLVVGSCFETSSSKRLRRTASTSSTMTAGRATEATEGCQYEEYVPLKDQDRVLVDGQCYGNCQCRPSLSFVLLRAV